MNVKHNHKPFQVKHNTTLKCVHYPNLSNGFWPLFFFLKKKREKYLSVSSGNFVFLVTVASSCLEWTRPEILMGTDSKKKKNSLRTTIYVKISILYFFYQYRLFSQLTCFTIRIQNYNLNFFYLSRTLI